MRIVGRIGGGQVPLGLRRGGQHQDERAGEAERKAGHGFHRSAFSLRCSWSDANREMRACGSTITIWGQTVMIATAATSRKKNGSAASATVFESLPAHGLQHEEVEADRRRDLGHLDDEHEEDAEPDEVEAGLLDHRDDDRRRQHDHRDAVERRAEQDVHHA